MGGGCEAVFNLNCPAGPVEVRENYTFLRRDLGRVERELGGHVAMLCEAWGRFHG
jgi:hypothetical protein